MTAHFVWCTKYRRPVLIGRVYARLLEIINEVCDDKGWEAITIEVMPDHVHALISYDPKSSASYVMNQIKGRLSHILREEFPHLRSRLPTLWSRSYFVSSVGVDEETIKRYIDTQYERPWRRK